jgi:hypothetical protein
MEVRSPRVETPISRGTSPWREFRGDAVDAEPDVGDAIELRVEDQPVGDPGLVGTREPLRG